MVVESRLFFFQIFKIDNPLILIVFKYLELMVVQKIKEPLHSGIDPNGYLGSF
jgi:hypothetical protein